MKTMARYNGDKLIDLLAERLIYCRKGIRLYEAVASKLRLAEDPLAQRLLRNFVEFTNEQRSLERWLVEQIEGLGGSADIHPKEAALIDGELRGLEEVLQSEGRAPALVHALLGVEVVSQAGWEVLTELAITADDEEARRAFARRRREQEARLEYVRDAVVTYARHELMGGPIVGASVEVKPTEPPRELPS
jgi:hypothetical protein